MLLSRNPFNFVFEFPQKFISRFFKGCLDDLHKDYSKIFTVSVNSGIFSIVFPVNAPVVTLADFPTGVFPGKLVYSRVFREIRLGIFLRIYLNSSGPKQLQKKSFTNYSRKFVNNSSKNFS